MAKADPLAKYNAKRDFAKTREPVGEIAAGTGNRFMVQKHDASRLHWDLRLEIDGVMKSWAVTRGPSLNPDDKRLAVRTEDHPLSYADFEGTIPKAEYGGGTVMLWDDGSWAPIAGKSAKDLDDGHLHFTLQGERMKGDWLLIRLKPRAREKAENWLLRKIDDAHAGGSDDLVETALTSVKTGRTMDEIAAGKSAKLLKSWKSSPGRGGGSRRLTEGAGRKRTARGGPAPPPLHDGPQRRVGPSPGRPSNMRGMFDPTLRPGEDLPMPKFRPVQLATLVDSVPTGNGWLHEMKYDGYRALVAIGGGTAKVFTRTGLDWTDRFPAITAAAAALPVQSALIDGEIVAFRDGRPDFSTLHGAISTGGDNLAMFAFDLLALDGEDLAALPLTTRKARLQPLLGGDDDTIRYSEHVVGSGEQLFAAMCADGFEGVVSKRADAPYRGTRTRGWVKIKCTHRQEFVIVGWSESDKAGRGFKSLLLAVNGADGLRYAGKVGTGFDTAAMLDLRAKLDTLSRKIAPVDVPRAAARGAHWVKPSLVAEVAFAEFTAENVVRHASFLGLREDKAARDVVAETPAAPPAPPPSTSSVRISSPDRVIDPTSRLTKGALAAYYETMAPLMLPWLGERPISLVRCPQGRAKQCFFQKHDAGSFGDRVHHVDIREKDGATEPYLYVSDVDGMLAAVQMGTIEFHGWGSRVDDVERPDRIVFDLDPDEGLDFGDVKKAADDIRQHLADMGLAAFAMLSGGKGVHVIVPLKPDAHWLAVKSFADRFARALAQAEPKRFTANMKKAERTGRIFIDWLRNQRGSTAILPYVVRARSGAPVAAPVSWSELPDIDTPALYTAMNADTLIARANGRDLRGWGLSDQTLPDV